MSVCVLDKRKKPLMPCSEKRARLLLERGRARVHKMFPFTIRLVDRTVEESVLQPIRLKVDPGSTTTGGCLRSRPSCTCSSCVTAVRKFTRTWVPAGAGATDAATATSVTARPASTTAGGRRVGWRHPWSIACSPR